MATTRTLKNSWRKYSNTWFTKTRNFNLSWSNRHWKFFISVVVSQLLDKIFNSNIQNLKSSIPTTVKKSSRTWSKDRFWWRPCASMRFATCLTLLIKSIEEGSMLLLTKGRWMPFCLKMSRRKLIKLRVDSLPMLRSRSIKNRRVLISLSVCYSLSF